MRPEFGLEEANHALVEMFLLSHCHALVRTPSRFTYYAIHCGTTFDHHAILKDEGVVEIA